MNSLSENYSKYLMYFVLTLFAVGFTGCSNDDDVDDLIIVDPTGSIVVQDNQTISDDQITIENVTVGQDSWVVAVMAGDEDTNNFITEPVMVEEGSNSDVELDINDDVNFTGGETGDQITIKLYADDEILGTPGIWDPSDDPIRDENDLLVTETITVFVDDDDTDGQAFSDFDTNQDGFLDADEIGDTYQNDFTTWDVDADGGLNEEEFSNTTFANTDVDDDDFIDEDEWDQGFSSMYGNYVDDTDFATFDTDADGGLSAEEWNAGFADTEWFTTYDADADTSVTETEWNTGLYTDWDVNNDGVIDENEYNAFRVYTDNW